VARIAVYIVRVAKFGKKESKFRGEVTELGRCTTNLEDGWLCLKLGD
jgi:hypothetical protein